MIYVLKITSGVCLPDVYLCDDDKLGSQALGCIVSVGEDGPRGGHVIVPWLLALGPWPLAGIYYDLAAVPVIVRMD